VSLNSISDLIVELPTTPGLHARESLGIARVDTKAHPHAAE
jgi:hypothetical protein